jgi:hypothetical protein
MNINLTLIIQIFNFLMVYYLLRFFLFKPTIKVIEEENNQKTAMLESIDQQKKSLEVQKKERQQHWYICQEYFLLHQPASRKPTTMSSFSYDKFSKHAIRYDDVAKVALAIHDLLKEKIKHVH